MKVLQKVESFMQNLLSQCTSLDYKDWKEQRNDLIGQLKPQLVKSPENDISTFYNYLENEIKRLINSKDNSEILRCLHFCSILYHFQRNHDIIHAYFSTISQKLNGADRPIANAIAKTFYWFAEDSSGFYQAFREPLTISNRIMKNHSKNYYNALILFKRIRRFLPSELIQIILSSPQTYIDIASSNDKESQIVTLKLFEFVFSKISDIHLQSNFDIFYESTQKFLESSEDNCFYCGVRFYDFLLYIKSFQSPPPFDHILSRADSKCNSLAETAIKLVFHSKQKFSVFSYDTNFFLKFILKYSSNFVNPFQVLTDFLLNFHDNIDWSLIFTFILQSFEKSPECPMNRNCPFFILNRVFQLINYQYKNDSAEDDCFSQIFQSNIEKINAFPPCKHYFKCTKRCPLLLTPKVVSFFENHFNSEDPIYGNCLILFPQFLHLFPPDINQFTDELNFVLLTTDDSSIKKRILKTLCAINTKQSIECIFVASLTDKDESIRVFALNLLTPQTLSKFGTQLFEYLHDFSFPIQKQAIKIISQVYNQNPLEFQPYIALKIQTLLVSVIKGIEVELLAEYASLLSSCTKYFPNSLPSYIYLDIIMVSLMILNSTGKKDSTFLSQLRNFDLESPDTRSNLTPSLITATPFDSSAGDSKLSEYKDSNINSPTNVTISAPLSANDSTISPTSNILSVYTASNSSGHQSDYGDIPMSSSVSHVSFREQFNTTTNDNSTVPVSFKGSFMSPYDASIFKTPKILEDYKKLAKEPNRGKLFRLFQLKYIEERDKYLLKAITNLSANCPHDLVNTVLLTFYNVFVKTQNEDLLQSAAKSLTKFAISVQNGLNLCIRCPQMTACLYQILSNTSNPKLAASIIRLLGTAFDSVDLLSSQALIPYSNDLSELISNTSSFCTNLVTKNLLKHLTDPDLLTLKTLSMIVDGDSTNSAKYIPKIVQVFIHALKKSSTVVRSQIFTYLITIAQKCPIDFVPLLPSFYPIFKAFICNDGCLRFLTLLSYTLKTDFIEAAHELYSHALHSLCAIDQNCFRSLITFIGSLIIYQNLPFEAFLNFIEKIELTKKTASPVIYITTTLIQSIDISGFTMRLVKLALNKLLFPKLDINDYFCSLCVYGNLTVSQMKTFYKAKHLTFSHFDQLEEVCSQKLRKRPPFLKEMSLKFPTHHSFLKLAANLFFADVEYPNELHINVWIKNLLKIMISRSSSSSIRAYAPLFSASSKFDSTLFDVALSCWKTTTDIDHDRLNAIVEYALQHHRNVHPIFFQMIYLSNKLLMPMKVDIHKVYELSSSRPNTLFIIQRALQMNPKDRNLNRMLINTLIQMGRFATARGLLEKVKPSMNKMDFAKWSDELGEWEKALEIYKQQKAGLPLIFNCLEEMCEYNEIAKYESVFQQMTDDEKRKVMDHFLWVFQLKNEKEKVEEIIRLIGDEWTLFRVIFAVYYYIKSGKYEKAKELIGIGYEILANNKNEYSLGDHNQLTEIHRMSQILVESEEVLNHKITNSSTEQITSFFTSRVKNFKRNRFIWERTICLRQILVPIESNISYYLPIISELRKAQMFKLIHYYFNQPIDICTEWGILIQRIKLNSKSGNEIDSLQFCQQIANGINFTKKDEFFEILQNMPMIFADSILYSFQKTSEFTSEMQSYLIEHTHSENIWESYSLLSITEKADLYNNFINEFKHKSAACMQEIIFKVAENNHFVSTINRLAGNYLLAYRPFTYESALTASQYFKVSVEFEPEKIKMWRNWAFINLRLFNLVKTQDNSSEKLDLYSKSAIEAFLKLCMHVPINDTLEYSSQLMSLVNASSDEITKKFLSDITSLPSAVIITILPLVTSKIDIPDLTKRSMIFTILINAGMNYFQEIYFPLNLYVDSNNNLLFSEENETSDESDSQKIVIASQILAKLREMRPKEAEEIAIFIDGMVRSAISWFELAMHSIETILKAFMKQKNDKAVRLLEHLFKLLDHPRCELDQLFLNLYQNVITSCRHHFLNMISNNGNMSTTMNQMKSYGRSSDSKNEETLLTAKLRSWYNSLKERVARLSVIFLSKISEDLTNKKAFLMNAPSYFDCKIESIDPVMDVLETQQHPRVAIINTTKGEKSKYLLKGNEDLRLDERLMMLFNLTNGIINRNPLTKEFHTSIIRYAVIPMTKTAGLIKWVTGADTFYQLITERRESAHMQKDAEMNVMKNLINCNFITLNGLQRLEIFLEIQNFGREKPKKAKKISIVDAKKSQISNSTTKLSSNLISLHSVIEKPKKKLNLISKNDTSKENLSKLNISMLSKLPVATASSKLSQVEEKPQQEVGHFSSEELADAIWLRAPNAAVWVKRTASFTLSYSLMAIVGYIIGLGDRHPGNIMIQRDSGNVVHIDFGESFDTAMLRSTYPEKVPFRLTKMVINALEGRIETGLFQEFAIDIMTVLRKNKDTLMAQLAVFFEEPALAHFKKIYARQTKTFLIDGCYKKLAGLKSGETEPIDVKQQVEQLIKCAADPSNYIKHYPGWCPFW